MRQLPLPVRLRASSVFDSFYAGPNQAAVAQLMTLQPNVKPTATWLYGPPGVGKTHLLQAICARAGSQTRTAAYLPMRELAQLDPQVMAGCETLSFVCIDDVETVAGDAAWERALFRLYTEVDEAGGRMLIAAASLPHAIGIALPDLASRFAAGAILKLSPLSDDEQMLALQARAARLGLELPFDTAQYLLRRLPRDMTTLCNTLEKLDEASLASQRRLTVPFVREFLEQQRSD